MKRKTIDSLAKNIKNVLNNNPELKEMTKISNVLAKAININGNTPDIFNTGKDYNNVEDAILDKLFELDVDITEEEQSIIEKYNLLEYDNGDIIKEEENEKKEVIVENVLPVEEKKDDRIKLIKRYREKDEIRIHKCKVYVSSNSKEAYAILTGRFYIYNKNLINGRIKISKRIDSKSIGWVSLSDIEVVKK